MEREITDRVVTIVAQQLGLRLDKVALDHHLRDDLGADSLDSIELVMACEEEFKIHIDDSEADKVTTVQGLVDLVQREMG